MYFILTIGMNIEVYFVKSLVCIFLNLILYYFLDIPYFDISMLHSNIILI